jgi:hypothetical protein
MLLTKARLISITLIRSSSCLMRSTGSPVISRWLRVGPLDPKTHSQNGSVDVHLQMMASRSRSQITATWVRILRGRHT